MSERGQVPGRGNVPEGARARRAPHQPARVLAEAALVIAAVVRGRAADEALAQRELDSAPPLHSAIRAVTLGTLRWYFRLDALAAALLAGRVLVPAVRSLLIAALHQLEFSRGRPEVSVSSAVEATRLLGQPRAAALMNALLRRFLRERDVLCARVLSDPVAASACPAWLLQALHTDWPDDWPQIVAAQNEPPPMSLRVDLTRCSLEAYQAELARHELAARAVPGIASALVLARPVGTADLPGFAAGLVSVQDAGAQLVPALLQLQSGQRVLDACAAPGGKTGALLEASDGGIELTAVDIDPGRLELVGENLRRLGRRAELVQADLTQAPRWWDGRPFDRILLDAPCSSVGVIRRHPDIRLLRRATDIEALAQVQRRMLAQCLALLRPGGILLYSTCSVLAAENDRVIAAVMADTQSVRMQPLDAAPSPEIAALIRHCSHGIQLLPGNAAGTDGFYYACVTVT